MSYKRLSAAVPSVYVLSAGVLVMVVSASVWAADTRKEFKYNALPGSTVKVSNSVGAIVVRPVAGRQVTIAATTHSDKVQVNSSQMGNRINATTDFVQPVDPGSKDGQVEYEVSVPSDCGVVIQNGSGVTRLDGVHSDVTLDAESGQIELSNITNAHVHVQTLDAPVTLTNIHSQHVEVVSSGGKVQMTNVTGHAVTAKTDSGEITYDGDFAGGGEYSLVNHTGNINVNLPATASVDLAARSLKGTVQNDFPFRPKAAEAHPSANSANDKARAFLGTSNSGLSSVQLNSFSGTIRVRKR
ncbi:MAG TPA: DUF4097 family beta strand repeat-containing protein [Terriglobales bacterium]|nr:DUF4097 family beta strand repeat-containing protein [Terriglobales bacterium]